MTREEAAVVKAAVALVREDRKPLFDDGQMERCASAALKLGRAVAKYEAWLKRMAKARTI